MLVADALLVDTNALEGQQALFFCQPAAVQLAVGHDEKKDDADHGGEKTCNEEDNLPGRYG